MTTNKQQKTKQNNTNWGWFCQVSRYENHSVQRTFSMTVRILEKNLRTSLTFPFEKTVSLTMSSSHKMSKNIHMRSATKQSQCQHWHATQQKRYEEPEQTCWGIIHQWWWCVEVIYLTQWSVFPLCSKLSFTYSSWAFSNHDCSVVLAPPTDRWMKDTHFVDVSWCRLAPAERLRPAAASAPPSGMLSAALIFPASLDSWPWERHLTPQMFVRTTAALGAFTVFKHISDVIVLPVHSMSHLQMLMTDLQTADNSAWTNRLEDSCMSSRLSR